MKKISSRSTFFYKRILPAVWFGSFGILLIVFIFGNLSKGQFYVAFFILPIVMAILGYFLMRAFIFDLMDEVWDEGNSLLVRNKNKVERIDFKNIKNIGYTFLIYPNRVTLSLRIPSQFGSEVSFSPLISSWMPFRKNKDIDELIDKVDKLRTG